MGAARMTVTARWHQRQTGKRKATQAYATHCAEMDSLTAPLRNCLSYYNGEGGARPGSLAYYGGNAWHCYRSRAQETLEPYLFT